MSPQPRQGTVHVVPWQNDFPAALARLLLAGPPSPETPRDLSAALVVFPHDRPRRYLLRALEQQAGGPLRPPETLTLNELAWRVAQDLGPPLAQPTALDRVRLARQAVAEVLERESRKAEEGPDDGPRRLPWSRRLAAMLEDLDAFLPWGLRLATLMDELYRQNMRPPDLHQAEDLAQPFAADILARLGGVFKAYTQGMDAEDAATPSRALRRVAETARREPATLAEILRGMGFSEVLFCGFHAMTEAEEALVRGLWEHDRARLVLHTDPALAQKGLDEAVPHYSTAEHAELLARWRAGAVLAEEPCGPAGPGRVLLYEGHDLHSQLRPLAQVLTQTLGQAPTAHEDLGAAAVVLPDSGMLMPVLHHLPKRDVNVSLGYPLERAPLFRLLEAVAALQRSDPLHERTTGRDTTETAAYHWMEWRELLRHPYLKMLGDPPLRPWLAAMDRRLERDLRNGVTHQSLNALLDAARAAHDEALREDPAAAWMPPEAARDTLHACTDAWRSVDCLGGAAEALAGLVSLLISRGDEADLWRRFPLDAEGLARLADTVLPVLRGDGTGGSGSLKDEPLSREACLGVLLHLVREQRVPFEAEPLGGLQVLGVLEARLLHFDTVFLPGATDDLLPGGHGLDPLLPEPLRALLGLPDASRSDLVAAYNFHRLMAGAREAHIFYHTGAEGALGGKGLPSRFVEEHLWQAQRQGRELPVARTHLALRPLSRQPQAPPRGPAACARMEVLLGHHLSPSLLDAYLGCPARFYYQRVARLGPPEDPTKDEDFPALGQAVHKALADFLAPHVGGGVIRAESLSAAELTAAFRRRLRETDFFGRMSLEKRLLMEGMGAKRLTAYLDKFPATRVLALEASMQERVRVEREAFELRGTLDRLDLREDRVLILDYKTGHLARPRLEPWLDEAFWDELRREYLLGPTDATLLELAGRFGSVQLPCYLLLQRADQTRAHQDLLATDAALVELRDEGRERFLFGAKLEDEETRQRVLTERVPLLIAFLVAHMRTATGFVPRPDKHCDWCPYRGPCFTGASCA